MSTRTLDIMKPYSSVENASWPLLEHADQAAGRYLLHGAGLPDLEDCEASLTLLEAIPRQCKSQVEHTQWFDALEALQAKYSLTFEEYDAIATRTGKPARQSSRAICSVSPSACGWRMYGTEVTDDAQRARLHHPRTGER